LGPPNEHLLIHQEKVNKYFGTIEYGELDEKYPAAKGRKSVISVVMLHHPNSVATEFLNRVKETLAPEGINFAFVQRRFDSPPLNRGIIQRSRASSFPEISTRQNRVGRY
jgi:hypothetical protein